jgi:hypothetical protein
LISGWNIQMFHLNDSIFSSISEELDSWWYWYLLHQAWWQLKCTYNMQHYTVDSVWASSKALKLLLITIHAWVSHRFHMDITWISHVHHMGITWADDVDTSASNTMVVQMHIFSLIQWTVFGIPAEPWNSYYEDPHIGITWILHVFRMCIIWVSYVHHMGIIWPDKIDTYSSSTMAIQMHIRGFIQWTAFKLCLPTREHLLCKQNIIGDYPSKSTDTLISVLSKQQ